MNHPDTSNPLRKWQKKLRNAKTPEDRAKAQQIIKALTPKPPKNVVRKLTDNELLDQAIKENKSLFKDKQAKDREDRENKNRSLERSRIRKQISDHRQEKEDKQIKQKEEYEKFQEHYKREQQEHYKRIMYHMDHVKNNAEQHNLKHQLTLQYIKNKLPQYDESNEIPPDKIDKLSKKHVKQIDRHYHKYLENMCYRIDELIHNLMKDKELSYEEALDVVYNH